MNDEIFRILELTKIKIDQLENEKEDSVKDLKSELKKLRTTIAEIEEPFIKDIKGLNEIQDNIKSDLIETWDHNMDVYTDEATGIKLQRRKNEKPDVHDLKELLAQAVTFDELPIKKVSWDNKTLKTLISTGVIPKDIASIQKTYNIAITHPK